MDYSVLFPKDKLSQNMKNENIMDRPYFKDLGIDLIFNPLIELKEEFDLAKYYFQPLQDLDTIYYRQEVMHELENLELRNIVTAFSNEVYSIRRNMNVVREALNSNDEWSNTYLMRGHMLDYAERYVHAITRLKKELSKLTVSSDGLLGLAYYVNQYFDTEEYQHFNLAVEHLREEFSKIEYSMLISNGAIKVRKYEGQKDYSKKIADTFEKFRQEDAKDYRHDLSQEPIANHVEAGVLDLLSKIYKETFDDLVNFCSQFIRFDDETIIRFSQEIQFYVSWLDYIEPLKRSGLNFNYPEMENTSDNIYGYDCFDLALAKKIRDKIVTNKFTLKSPESIIVITGPNQGGKTTFARMFGQMHYLASIGLCIPGKESSLFLFDNIFTHFSREEDLSNQSGKLKDDLQRIFDIITRSTDKSLIIINEIFTSTTLEDAIYLGNRIMDRLVELKSPTMIVTFIDELALYSEDVVSMMSLVKDDNPVERTYKIVRKPPDGSAYAIHIASRNNLTYEKLSRRLRR